MKKIYIIFLVLFFAINSAIAQDLSAYLSTASFNSPTEGPYFETYLSVVGNSIVFNKTENGKFQGTIEITIIFRKDEKIENFAKYELKSPEIADTSFVDFNFLDQQRFALTNGTYNFEIYIKDRNNKNSDSISTSKIINIQYPDDKISISGIELINSFKKSEKQNILTKGGYDIIPYISKFFPENRNSIIFYSEVYNSDKTFGSNEKYLISYYIESFETGKKIDKFISTKRIGTKPVNIVFNEFDITGLPSGNYNLVIEARDKKNDLIAINKLFFQRSNPNINFEIKDITALNIENTFVKYYENKDILMDNIRSLTPISTEVEKSFALRQLLNADLKTMQQYFLNFWLSRDNIYPETAWNNYYEKVKIVNVAYKTQIRKGYDTDRGRIYLKYGEPNTISERHNEPSAYPYEIWHYYKLGDNQRNKKFVFYVEDIVTNDFVLIHSDAIGELSNYRWQILLHDRSDPRLFDKNNFDATREPDAWGNKASDFYGIPR
ncbi:MAG: GWxTD domain-containing protein [Bacteroidales bacterium]|nr:GWxTD domain-containing protein [Bacteroidales bacterium]